MSGEGAGAPRRARGAAAPLVIHAVVRNRRTESVMDVLQGVKGGPEFRLVGSGDLAAVVTPRQPGDDDTATLRLHARVVARLLRRSSVVPIPEGLEAEDDEAVRGFLQGQRIPLAEALDFLEDGYELRLHISARGPGPSEDRLRSAAHHVYEQLQQQSRAARILSEGADDRILSAAFLIPRGEWIGFVEQIADWEERYSALRMDVTGPWAAWDFVHVMARTASATGEAM